MIIIFTKKKFFEKLFLILAVCFCAGGAYGLIHKKSVMASGDVTKAYMAIVIDDFGYNGEGTAEMLGLDIPFTAAVMPFSEHSAKDSELVKEAGKELILHMPMESLTGKKSWVGDKGIFSVMTDEEITARINEALDIVKYAVGINNHMGSKIMEDERSLNVIMSVAAEKGLIFIDSKTTPKSLAVPVTEKYNIPLLVRDIFLDSTNDIAVVKKQLLKAADIALKNGSSVAIGHVGPEGGKITAQAIKDLIPELKSMGIEFVTVTQLKDILKK